MSNSADDAAAASSGESIASLRHQLSKQPDNQGIRMRLVRALHAAGKTEEFETESAEYKKREMALVKSLQVDGAPSKTAKSSPAPKPKPDPVLDTERERIRRFADDDSAASSLAELAGAYKDMRADPKYLVQLDLGLARQGGRPTPLIHATRLSQHLGGAQIYFKLEYVAGSDAHLQIAASGQAHLANCLGRKKVVAGVRDIKWGLRMAHACARLGLKAEVFLDSGLLEQQSSQAFQMRLMGAQVTKVDTRNFRGGDVREAGLEAWLERPRERFMFLGLDNGPRPYPDMASDNTAVIGRECRRQMSAQTGRAPEVVVVRGGENTDALGLFPAFLEQRRVRLVSVEPDPDGTPEVSSDDPFRPAPGRGEDKRTQALLTGLEYVSVAREISQLHSTGRVEKAMTDQHPALNALREVARLEGIVVGLQTAHALAWVFEAAKKMSSQEQIVVLLKERGEADLWNIMRLEGFKT